METALAVSQQVIVMVLIAACGVVLKKAGKITDDLKAPLSNILLYLVSPILIINSFIRPFKKSEFSLWLLSIAMSLIIQVLLIIISKLTCRRADGDRRGIDRFAVCYSNAAFIGIPLIQASLGPDGVFFLIGFICASGLFMWTYGAREVSGGRYKLNAKKILLNPSNIGAAIGFIIYILQIDVGSILTSTLQSISNINTAASMIIIGILVSNVRPKEILSEVRVFKVALLRLVLCPLLVLGLGALIMRTGIAGAKMAVMVNLIASSTPAASATAMMATIFGSDDVYAGKVVAVTTVCSVITIPAIMFLAGAVL